MNQQLTQFIANHWVLFTAFALIIFLISLNELTSQLFSTKQLSTTEAIELINYQNAIVIDLRDKKLFDLGHVLNSISVPDADPSHLKRYSNDNVILLCADGVSSAKLMAQLHQQGLKSLVSLSGGINAWQAAKLPLVKTKKTSNPQHRTRNAP